MSQVLGYFKQCIEKNNARVLVWITYLCVQIESKTILAKMPYLACTLKSRRKWLNSEKLHSISLKQLRPGQLTVIDRKAMRC